MSFSFAPLLVHSEGISAEARTALRAALAAPEAARQPLLQAAARALHRDAELECSDALELVGLSAGGC